MAQYDTVVSFRTTADIIKEYRYLKQRWPRCNTRLVWTIGVRSLLKKLAEMDGCTFSELQDKIVAGDDAAFEKKIESMLEIA